MMINHISNKHTPGTTRKEARNQQALGLLKGTMSTGTTTATSKRIIITKRRTETRIARTRDIRPRMQSRGGKWIE